MKRFSVNKTLITWFLGWRIALFGIAYLAVRFISNFGNRFPYADRVLEITGVPSWIWSFGNFDGVHFLRIAQNGYNADFTQAFFPLYPLLTRALASVFPKVPNLDTNIFTDPSFFWSGFILSNLFFIFFIFVFYKLVRLDFKKEIALTSCLAIFIFPTSFYFGATYSESLFFFLVAISLYLLRRKNFLFSAIFISLSSATRIVGIALVPVYLIELYKTRKVNWQSLLGLVISPLGLIIYMLYLNNNFGDAFYFFSSQPAFGAGRSGGELIFPLQTVFRYLKILATVPPLSLPFFNAFLEFSLFWFVITILITTFKKAQVSYWIFVLLAFLLPSLTGTFSSMPRYALISIFLFPYLIIQWKRGYNFAIVSFIALVFLILGFFLLGLFTRGYWVAGMRVEKNQFITIVNPVRISSYTKDLEANLKSQYAVIRERDLPATWLLTYDVLKLEAKERVLPKMDDKQELGLFLEITPTFAADAGVTYNESPSWHFANSVFLSGYIQEDRVRLIRTIFEKFKEVFGHYPTTVGSWWTDSYSLSYMKENYGVTANMGVTDQFSTDGYQVWGTYWSTPYYPSRYHAGIPAPNEEEKLDIVMLQWAPRDPLNGYKSSLFSTQDYKVLENPLDKSYFEKLVRLYGEAHDNEFGQVVVGLESDLSPESYAGEFANQMDVVRNLVQSGEFKAVSVDQFSTWYKNRFKGLTPQHLIKSRDILGSDREVVWYQSSKYRIGVLYDNENGKTRIFDLRSYHKGFMEPYFDSPNKQYQLSIYIPSLFDEVMNKESVWEIPYSTKFEFRENGFSMDRVSGRLPKIIKNASFVRTYWSPGGTKIEFKDSWIVGKEAIVFTNFSIETLHYLRGIKNTLSLLIGKGWDKLDLDKYYVSQGEIDALFHLASLPWGKVLIHDKECLQCSWHTPFKPAIFSNLRGYVGRLAKKQIVTNQKVFEADNQNKAREEFEKTGAQYLYLVKYENYVEKIPFSPGDLNIEKVYDNANAEVWKVVR